MFLLNDGYFLIEDVPDEHLIIDLKDGEHFKINNSGLKTLKKCLYENANISLEEDEQNFLDFLFTKGILIEDEFHPDLIYRKWLYLLQSKTNDSHHIDANILSNFIDLFSMRKHQCLPYLQLFLLPSSTLRRADWLSRKEMKSVNIFGDDDLLCLAIALINPNMTINVFDIDPTLIRFIENASKQSANNIKAFNRDLKEPFSDSHYQAGIFVTEPDDWGDGFTTFVGRGFEVCGLNSWGLVGLSELANVSKLLNTFLCTVDLVSECETTYFGLFSRGSKKPSICPQRGSTIRVSDAKSNPFIGQPAKSSRFYGVDVFNINYSLRCQKETNAAAYQSVIAFYNVAVNLENQDLLDSLVERIIAFLGLEVMGHHWYRYTPHGKTGVYILHQSSMTIHTWPEASKLLVDIISCGGRKDVNALAHDLCQTLSTNDFKISTTRL